MLRAGTNHPRILPDCGGGGARGGERTPYGSKRLYIGVIRASKSGKGPWTHGGKASFSATPEWLLTLSKII